MRSHPSLYRLLPLSFLLLNSLLGSTVSAELAARGNCCSGGSVDDDGNCATDPSDVADEAPTDGRTGIGFELEAGGIQLEPEKDGCTDEQKFKAKGHVIDGRTGTNWERTADTTAELVDVEYILDGKTITLGSGDLQKAAEDAAKDVVSCFLQPEQSPSNIEIDGLGPSRRDEPKLFRD